MNKQELTELIRELVAQLPQEQKPVPVKEPVREEEADTAQDISKLDLRKLYLVENAANGQEFIRLKSRTPARLGSGRAGARYQTLTMLRFRADHAAAQDTVFSQVPEEFARENALLPVQTRCKDKEEYLTRPDLGRCFDETNRRILQNGISQKPAVLLVVGDGLSSAAVMANAMDCLKAIRDGLKLRNISVGQDVFVRYCRVGAGDAIGDITGCELVCMLVGERPGLVTDKSMSAYITYRPHSGISESSRSVVSNIHDQGTPAVEAGAYIAELIQTILQKQASGVALHAAQRL